MKKILFRAVLITVFIFVFFVGVPFVSAFIGYYIVNTPSANLSVDLLQSVTTNLSVSLHPAYVYNFYSGSGKALYKIERYHNCGEYDNYGECVDGVDLCPYLSLQPKNEDSTETGFELNASNPYELAKGEINGASDTFDDWDVVVTSPCFEGECPADYNEYVNGVPLPQSQKGKVFTCDLYVEDGTPIFQTRNIIGPSITYAQSALNVMQISAVLTGNYTPPVTGFSSVLFLPGLEASRLYMTRADGSEDQLWEPNWITDVEDLYLNTDGTSITPDIYTDDIIKETNVPTSILIGQNIYKSFSETMDGLVADGKINRWEPYAYDWRQSVQDIVDSGTKYSDGKISLLATLQTLVDTSKNGKVTIVAHSNGGLLAKALLVKLQEMKTDGTSNLLDKIDNLILVAVPQIGTAGAVPAILHGYDQNIGFGLLLNETHARELGQNMPGAYGLLPTREYINQMSASPIGFADNVIPSEVTTDFVNAYGNVIDSYLEYKNFLFGSEGRIQPAIADTLLPINLSTQLFSEAETLHNKIDTWIPPASLRVIEVAGWGLDTVASFEYYPKLTGCNGSDQGVGCTNPYSLDERPIFTIDGDKTVVEPSALFGVGEKVWVDLKRNNRFKPGILGSDHKNILEVSQLNNYISAIIKKESPVYDLVLNTAKPADDTNRLRISVHSPVTIGAYDKEGNFTGKVCPQTSEFCYKQEDIPNSSYLEFGEGKYINLPEDSAQRIALEGTDIGTFTYESTLVLPNGQSTTTTFFDIPVTTQTEAEVTLNSITQIPELALDVTGDGTTDFTITQQTEFNPVLFLQIMRKTVESFDISKQQKNTLLRRIDDTIKAIEKGKINKVKLKIEQFKKFLTIHSKESEKDKQKREKENERKHEKEHREKRQPKRLSLVEIQTLLSMINQLLDNLNK